MPLPDYPPAFWITAIFAVTFFGISKGGFGGGAGFLATPLMSLFIPVADAAALLLVLLIIMDMMTVPHYRKTFHRSSLTLLLGGAIVGVFFGALFFTAFSENDRIFRVFIGALALAYVAYHTFSISEKIKPGDGRYFKPLGILAGITAGFTSTIAHAGAPPATMFLLPQKHPKEIFVGTLVILFTVVNLIKLIPYTLLGLIEAGNIPTILLLLPCCFIGVRLGITLNKRFDPVWFTRTIYILLFLTGIQLVFEINPVSLLLDILR